MTYKAHYDAFHNNANYAARVFQYYESIEKSNTHRSRQHVALNRSARFWLDWRFMALKTVILTLAKIFDDQRRTHNMRAMLRELPLEFYSTAGLIQRRRAGGMNDQELLDSVASRSHDLTAQDLKRIEAQAQKAEALWVKFEPLRNRFYAHHQMLTDAERDRLFARTTYKDLKKLIQILLNIGYVLEASELNGTKPDFRRTYSSPFKNSEREAGRLMKTLIDGVP